MDRYYKKIIILMMALNGKKINFDYLPNAAGVL